MSSAPGRVKLVLSVDALLPPLSGIGRYTWELASRMPHVPSVGSVRFFRAGQWVADPSSLLVAATSPGKRRLKPPRWAKEIYWRNALRGAVFHGPNYLLPRHAENAVATVHDLSVFKFPETHPVERIRQFEREFANSMALAKHLITDSQATRQEVMDFLAWPADRITAVPLGVSPQFAPAAADHLSPALRKYGLTQGGYVLCVSTLEPRKKIANLLLAYQCLPASMRNQYPLVLVGGYGWLSEELHGQVNRLSVQGWLRYLGFVPEADLPVLYAGARAFAYPSIYEGFGLPVLEAMASGVPVVTSNRSCLPELTQGAALLVEPDDIDALAQCIATSVSDEVWRGAASENGLAAAKAFTWERCVEATARVYRSTQS